MITWDELPSDIQGKMLERQYEQIGIRNEEIFIKFIKAGSSSDGFNWKSSEEGHDFWEIILNHGNIDHFYTKYIKKEDLPLEELIKEFKELL